MASDFGLKIGVEGEKEFKSALADINNQFKVLKSEMNLATSAFDKNEKSVEALSAKNEVLNKQIETQKQKIETLRSALQNSAESFGENDRRTQNWQVQLNNAEAALNGMERELEENNKALNEAEDGFDEAGDEAGKFAKEVDDAGEQSEDAGSKFKKLGEIAKTVGKAMAAAVAAIGAAAVAAGKQLWDMANDVAEAGDIIDKQSQKVGLSYESYQKWDYAMQLAGTSMSNCTTGLKTLTNTFDDAQNGSAGAIEKFERLGLSMDDLKGKSREEIFAATVEALQNVTDETEKAALANDMFGKSGQDLLPLLNQSTEETQALLEEAEKYGMVMSDDAVKASAAFEDSLSKLQGTMGGLKNRMVGELLPGITQIMDGLSDLAVGNAEAGEEIKTV